jgi:CHAT domain-containing protein/tetratricopeptide (TPR) repeat protein
VSERDREPTLGFQEWAVLMLALSSVCLLRAGAPPSAGTRSRLELATLFAVAGVPNLPGCLAPPFRCTTSTTGIRGSGNESRSEPARLRLNAAASAVIADGAPRDAGVALLLIGDSHAAVENLAALAHGGSDASTWIDLSAAYLSDCTKSDLERCIDAAGAADHALEIAQGDSIALFNRAVALEHLGLLTESRHEWSRCAVAADSIEMAREARANAERLSWTSQPWREIVPLLERAAARGDQDWVARIVRSYPRDARAWGESVYLPAWADATARGDLPAAEKALETARLIGTALQQFSDERMTLDAITAIDRAVGSPARTGNLLSAYSSYVKGGKAHRDLHPIEAERLMRDAEASFARAGSPMALVARYYVASAMYVQLRVVDAAAMLDDFADEHPEARGYRALGAQIGWERGLSLLLRGRYSDAVRTFEQSAALFEALDEQDNRATMEDFLADAMEFLGDSRSAWIARRNALETLSRSGNVERQIHSLTTTANALIRRKEWERALALLNISTHLAVSTRNEALAVSAFTQRSIVHNSLRDAGSGNRDLTEASQWLARIRDTTIASRLNAEFAFAAALSDRGNPNAAIVHLTRALDYFRESGAEVFMASALLERARAYRELGREASARSDLDEGLRLLEHERKGVDDLNQRATMFVSSDELFAESIDLALARGDVDTAFTQSERARGRALLDFIDRAEMRSGSMPAAPLMLSEIERELASDAAIVEYRVLPAGLVAFVIRRDGLHTFTTPIAPKMLSRINDECVHAARMGDTGTARSACMQAAKLLIGPARASLADAHVVAFIPDAHLSGFPFALIAGDMTVVEAPSATLAVECSLRSRKTATGTALIIAATSFDSTRFRLDALARVPAETSAIAALRSSTMVLEGAQVTKERLQRELPTADVIHFAGHAIENAIYRTHSKLLLESTHEQDDLTAADIATMRLGRAPLVYLSACRSGSAGGHSDGIQNLALAFLVAGSPTVIASRWNIDDEAAASIATRFHRALLRTGDAATALSEAVSLRTAEGNGFAAGAGMTVVGGTPRLVN